MYRWPPAAWYCVQPGGRAYLGSAEVSSVLTAVEGSSLLAAMRQDFALRTNNGSLDPTLDGCYAPTLLSSGAVAGGVGVIALAFAGSAIQLVPDGTLLFHLGLIILMVSLLNATLLKPINRVLAERERRTKGSAAEAQSILASVDNKIREYQQRLREARTKGYSLLNDERKTASRERELKVTEVKAEVARWVDLEKQALKRDEEQARSSLEKDAEGRAFEIGARILGRSIGSR